MLLFDIINLSTDLARFASLPRQESICLLGRRENRLLHRDSDPSFHQGPEKKSSRVIRVEAVEINSNEQPRTSLERNYARQAAASRARIWLLAAAILRPTVLPQARWRDCTLARSTAEMLIASNRAPVRSHGVRAALAIIARAIASRNSALSGSR